MSIFNFGRIGSLLGAPAAINGVITKIEAAFATVLSKNDNTGNQMTVDLDMNNNHIYNLPAPVEDTEPVRLIDIEGLVDYAELVDLKEAAEQAAADAEDAKDIAVAAAAAAAASAGSIDIRTISKASDIVTTTPGSNTQFLLKEYNADSFEGGGSLIYSSTSTATVNDGTVFNAPASIGRFIRPVDGILHSNWFGIVDSTVTDQSQKLQKFLNEAIANKYTAFIDNGYIDCNGAQIYINQTWAGNTARPGGGAGGTAAGGPIAGFVLQGANRRYATIGHALIHVGAIGAYGGDGLASGALNFSNFFVDNGGIVSWSNEVASSYRDVRIFVGPACSTSFSIPSTGTPGTTYGSFATNSGFFGYGCNQLNLDGLRVECPTDEVSLNYYGVWLDSVTNVYWNGGGVNTCGKGLVLKQTGLEFSQASQNFVMRDCHFESNIQETVYIEEGKSIRLQGHFRGSDTVTNGAWDRANYPVIRLGNAAAVKTPYGITIANSYLVGKSDLNATAILLERCVEADIKNNNFTTFVNGVVIYSGAFGVAPISKNNFISVTNEVVRNTTTSTYSIPTASERIPVALSDTTNVTWRVENAPNAKLNLATASARTLSAPINPSEGMNYRLIVNKSNASGTLSFNAIYLFPSGTAPDISSMTTSQTCIINFYYDGTNMLGTYNIIG